MIYYGTATLTGTGTLIKRNPAVVSLVTAQRIGAIIISERTGDITWQQSVTP